MLNVAVTVVLAFKIKEQVFAVLPTQAPPLQPTKEEPEKGAAVRLTVIPGVPDELQVEPQFIKPVEVTVPEPVPDFKMETVYDDAVADLYVAVTVVAPAGIVMVVA